MEEQITNLAITNPNKSWVAKELAKLIDEWIAWQKEVDQIQDYPYDNLMSLLMGKKICRNMKYYKQRH